MSCKWNGTENPRVLIGRHEDDCKDDNCRGCQPCTEPHCIVCGIEHVIQRTCPTCVGVVRTGLTEIRRMWRDLPNQMFNGGNYSKLDAAKPIPGGEAMVLVAPASDGRAVVWARERGDDVTHQQDEKINGDSMPTQLMLGNWEDDWRKIRRQQTHDRFDVYDAIEYLQDHLSWAAQYHDAFDAFATEVAQQVTQLENVLHDGKREDTGAPCLKCGTTLVLEWASVDQDESADRWWCKHCKVGIDVAEYARTNANTARPFAKWLSATDMEAEWRIKPGSLRGWAAKKEVRKRKDFDTGRVVYNVADAKKKRDGASDDTTDAQSA